MLNFHRTIVAFSFLLLTSSVAFAQDNSRLDFALKTITTAQNSFETDSQQPSKGTEPSDPNRVAAEKAEAEAQALVKQDAPLLTQVIPKWEEALKYWRLVGDRKKEATALSRLSGVYAARGDYKKALEYAQKSLPICESLKDSNCQRGVIATLSFIYQFLGEYQKDIDMTEQVPSLYPEAYDMLPISLVKIAGTYGYNLNEKQKAIDYYNQALSFWKERGDAVKQAKILQDIAFFYNFLGDLQKGLETINQANTLDPEFKRAGYDAYFTSTTEYCSDKLAALKKPPTSDQSQNPPNRSTTVDPSAATNNNIEKAKQLIQKSYIKESLLSEAQSLGFLGGEYYRIGEYQKALEVYQKKLKLTQLMGAKLDEAETLTNIADIFNFQGKKQEAINSLNQALEIERQLKVRSREAETLVTLGNVYSSLGAYPQSLETYNQALSIFQVIGNLRSETDTLINIGSIYKYMQKYPQSLNAYQQALSLFRTTENCAYKAISLLSISQAYFASGDYPQAIRIANQVLALKDNLQFTDTRLMYESAVLILIAKVENKQGNYSKSLELSQKARKIAQDAEHRKDIEANWLTVTAEAYEALKQPEKAIQTYQEQLSLYRQISLLSEQASTLYNIAKLQRQNNQLQIALSEIDKAIEIIENIRKEVASPELRTSFFATKQDYYELKILILMELHRQDPNKGYDAQAFDTSERARARTLLELLNEANADIRNGVDPVLLEQSKTLQYKLAALDKRWSELINGKFTPEQKNAFERDRKQLLEQYQDIEAQIRAKSPKYAALTQPKPLTLAQVQQQVLDSDTVLLQYSLGKAHSYLWVVTNTGITSYKLPSQPEIEQETNLLLDQLKNSYKTFPPINPSPLSSMILAPAREQLTSKKRILVVADGILNYIPFNVLSLPNQQQPLISQYELINAPSSSSVALLRQDTQNRHLAPKTLAIFADPVFSPDDPRIQSRKSGMNASSSVSTINMQRSLDSLREGTLSRLPGTGNEAKNILQLIPDKDQKNAAFDFNANLLTATNPKMSQYRIVHFATHGILNSEAPELSGIVLSLVNEQGEQRDGFLNLNKIFNLDLPAELVVLSACQTGLGRTVKGEGIVGLTRGFMYAGAPRVMVSLWSVADDATAFLMSRFYHYLLQEKLTPSAALRAAQLEIQRQTEHPAWHSPFYWAAFTLQGEWR